MDELYEWLGSIQIAAGRAAGRAKPPDFVFYLPDASADRQSFEFTGPWALDQVPNVVNEFPTK